MTTSRAYMPTTTLAPYCQMIDSPLSLLCLPLCCSLALYCPKGRTADNKSCQYACDYAGTILPLLGEEMLSLSNIIFCSCWHHTATLGRRDVVPRQHHSLLSLAPYCCLYIQLLSMDNKAAQVLASTVPPRDVWNTRRSAQLAKCLAQ